MSENNYGALMLKSALDTSVDVTKIIAPGIYPVTQGNASAPDSVAGSLTVAPVPSGIKVTFERQDSSIVYSLINGKWEKPTATDVGAVPSTRKINGHALTGDTNVTAQDIFNGQVVMIGANQNLDNYQTPGLYAQDMNSNTSAALNYPENNAGSLMVLRSAGVTQIYRVYNSSRIWSRSKYSTGPWTTWAREYNTQNKPGAGDVDALPITGGMLNGPLGIGTANGLGGNSIVIGDSDTGFKQEGDGILNVYANSALVMRFISSLIESLKPLKVNGNCIATGELQAANGGVRIATNGNIYGTNWGGWLDAWLRTNYQPKGSYTPAGQAYTKAESDARYVQDIRLGAQVLVNPSGNGGKASLTAPSGHMLTAILDGDTSRWPMPDSPDQAYARPIQKLVNGKWITVAQL